MQRIGGFFIVVALIAAMVGCGGTTPSPCYTLSINATAGGVVTAGGMNISGPGEVLFGCVPSGVFYLLATPATSYTFVAWSGDVSTIGNVTAAHTTITMSGNYSITANFALTLP